MGGVLAGGSILAAFFGGAVALFSPCCVVFLLPSYLATAVKNRRWRLLPITIFFMLGLATILVPITLGVGLLAATIARFHVPLYVAGGAVLFALGVLSLSGRTWSLPAFIRSPDVTRSDSAGAYALGVFSGVASSCCAPVLAGIMTLSALSSTLAGSALLGVTYVFGMTVPLVVMAVLWDRLQLGERRFLTTRPMTLRVGGRDIHTNTINVGVAVAFFAMAVVVWVLALTGNTTATPTAQVAFGRWLEGFFSAVLRFVDPVPEPVLGAGLLAFAVGLFALGFRSPRRHAVPDDLDREPEHERVSQECH